MNFPGCGFKLFVFFTLSLPPNYLVASSLLRTTQDAEATPYGDNHYNPTDVIIQMYKKIQGIYLRLISSDFWAHAFLPEVSLQ